MLPLFCILLPTKKKTHAGGADYLPELRLWEGYALSRAGGFTATGFVTGTWRDDETGLVYTDRMAGYEIACASHVFNKLIDDARRLFPDQRAFFTATVGIAQIVYD